MFWYVGLKDAASEAVGDMEAETMCVAVEAWEVVAVFAGERDGVELSSDSVVESESVGALDSEAAADVESDVLVVAGGEVVAVLAADSESVDTSDNVPVCEGDTGIVGERVLVVEYGAVKVPVRCDVDGDTMLESVRTAERVAEAESEFVSDCVVVMDGDAVGVAVESKVAVTETLREGVWGAVVVGVGLWDTRFDCVEVSNCVCVGVGLCVWGTVVVSDSVAV